MFRNNTKKNLCKIAASFGIFLLLLSSALVAQAQNSKGSYNFSDESGLNLTGKEAGYNPSVTPEPEAMLGTIIQTILSFVGVIFLAFMIYGGITWLTAQGDNQKVTKAKAIIEESIVGIIIVIIAYSVTSFLIEYFTPIIGGSV